MKSMKKLCWVVLLLSLVGVFAMTSCNKDTTSPTSSTDNTSAEHEVMYVGGETEEDVVKSLPEFEEFLGRTLTQEERDNLLKDFRQDVQDHPEWSVTPENLKTSTYAAYTSHYKWSGHDWDLWLEYKWYTGARDPGYSMYSASYALYWTVRRCYGGNIWNWAWKEGNYKRVTAVVGTCLYVPFASSGNWYLRNYLRVRSY